MKLLTAICLLFITVSTAVAQVEGYKSEVRIKVDSIIQYQIGYTIDSTTNVIPQHKWDASKHRGMTPTFSSLTSNPMTLIIANGKLIEIEDLHVYQLEDIAEINVYPKNDKRAMAIYGASARNGLIIIKSKE